MVMKYENELQSVQQELQESYTLIKAEEKKRFLLEEEIRKILTKNMSTMNVEALHLFQSINSNRDDFPNLSIVPNSATKSIVSESHHSVMDENTPSNTSTNNGHDLSRLSTPTHANTTYNANSSVLNSGGGSAQTAGQASEASVLLAKLNAQQYLYNTARNAHSNSVIRDRSPSPVPAQSPSHSPIPTPQEAFDPHQSSQSRSNFNSNSRIRFANNTSQPANTAAPFGYSGYGSNQTVQSSEPTDGQPHGQYLNKLSEMYRMSMQSSNKLAKMPSNQQQPSQQYSSQSQGNHHGRPSSAGGDRGGAGNRGSSTTMRTNSANSSTKPGGGGFGQTSSRFK